MEKIYTLVLFLVAFTAVNAQDFRLGRVSKEELVEKVHPKDTSAAAAVLYKSGKTYFEVVDGYFNVVHEKEFRIKIYKKEGYEYATDQNVVYTGGRTIKAYYTDAYTYNLIGDKIEKTRLKSDGEFEEKKNENFTIEKITMPNVKEGSVIEFKYIMRTPYITVFDDYYFQYDIPVNYVDYEISIPNNYIYNRYMKGYVQLQQTHSKRTGGKAVNFEENVTKFTARDVPALKEEPFVNNIQNYVSVLSHELASVHSASKGFESFATDWQSVAEKIYKDDDFGKELNQTSYFEKDLAAVIKPDMTNGQKTNAIFSFVKDRMNWNKENRFYCEKGVKKAYVERTGNTAEINLMLIGMLRQAGIEANPVLISTRSNGIALFPSRTAFNYVVAAVETNGGQILLDATSKNTLANILPLRALNWTGRLIKKNGGSAEIDLMPKKLSREVINIAAEIDVEGKVSGKARDQYFDYNAYAFRENYGSGSKDSYVQKIENRYKGIQVDEYRTSNTQDLQMPVIEEYSFTHDGLADVIGDKIYLSPMLFFVQSENPFKTEKREFPVDFSFPYQDKYLISLKIPAGYTVESLPEPLAVAMEENIGNFKYNIEAANNNISLIFSYDMNYANISPAYYQTLKDFYQKMVEKQNEKIVLKKI